MSTFQQALEQEADGRSNQCRMCKLLDSMEDPDRAALIQALNNSNVGASKISRALDKIGHDIKDYTVTRHRRMQH